MVTRTDGSEGEGHPALRTLREDAAIAAMTGILANPATTGSDTSIAPSVAHMSVLLADQLVAALAVEKQS